MISLQLTSGEIRLVNKSKLFNQQNQPPLPDDHSQENVLEKVRVPLVGDLLGRERELPEQKKPDWVVTALWSGLKTLLNALPCGTQSNPFFQ